MPLGLRVPHEPGLAHLLAIAGRRRLSRRGPTGRDRSTSPRRETDVGRRPDRFTVLDLQTIGYTDGVVLPIDVRLQRPGEPLSLRATVDYLTCADICVPYTADLSLDLPAGPRSPSARSPTTSRRRARSFPDAGAGSGLSVEAVRWRARRQAAGAGASTSASPEPLASAGRVRRSARRRWPSARRRSNARARRAARPTLQRRGLQRRGDWRSRSTACRVTVTRGRRRPRQSSSRHRRAAGSAPAQPHRRHRRWACRRSWRWRCWAASSST